MNEEPRSAQRTYWCFISYRHADNKEPGRQWATWLHQAIETYEVPDDLVGSVNDRGDTIPARIFPVFRDEEELPVDADLASPIYGALDASKFLIVICSPRSVVSTYVGNEIHYFKQLGRANRVLAVMIEGEPNVSVDAGKQADGLPVSLECFHKALRNQVAPDGSVLQELTEPIAADFRLGFNQGWTSLEAYKMSLRKEGLPPATVEQRAEDYRKQSELMKLKVIAGILGVPLGTLTQRDKAYQLALAQKRAVVLHRWLFAVGLLAILAIAGGALAEKERQEAVQNASRADAEAKKADAEAASVRRGLAQSYVLQAAQLNGTANSDKAAAYLAQAVRLDPGNLSARARLFAFLAHKPFPEAMLVHDASCNSAHFSPDGGKIIVTTANGEGYFWDAKSSTQIGAPLPAKDNITRMLTAEYNATGSRLAVIDYALEKTVQVYDTASNRPLGPAYHFDFTDPADWPSVRIFINKGDSILGGIGGAADINHPPEAESQIGWGSANFANSADVSPDEKKIVVGWGRRDRSGGAGVYDVATQKPLFPELGTDTHVFYTRFTAGDARVLIASSGASSGKLYLLDAATGDPKAEPVVFSEQLRDVQLSPDGKMIAACFGKDGGPGTARVYYASTLNPVAEKIDDPAGILGVRFNPAGTVLTTISANNSVRLWKVDSAEALTPNLSQQQSINDAEFSPDGTRLLTASDDGTVFSWDAARGPAHDEVLSFGHLEQRDLSPNGQWVAGSVQTRFTIWNTRTGTKIFDNNDESGTINVVKISPDSTKVVTGSNDKTARIWDIATGKLLAGPLAHAAEVEVADFSPDSETLVTGDKSGNIQFWDVATGKASRPAQSQKGSMTMIQFSADGNVLATTCLPEGGGTGSSVTRLWNGHSGNPISDNLSNEYVVGDGFSADGHWFATAFTDQMASPDTQKVSIRLRDLTSEGKPIDFPAGKYFGGTYRVRFSPDSNTLLYTCDNEIHLIDTKSRNPVGKPLKVGQTVSSVAFSPDGKTLVTVADAIQLWNVATGIPLSEPLHTTGVATGAAFNSDGTVLATTTDQETQAWEVATSSPLTEPLKLASDRVSFAPHDPFIFAGDFIWKAPVPAGPMPEWFISLAESAAGWHLDENNLLKAIDRKDVYAQRDKLLASPETDSYSEAAKAFLGAGKVPLTPLPAWEGGSGD